MNEKLKELFFLFIKLGITAFGGPAAHIAMMEEEVVQRRQWISQEHFLDLIGATNLIPGPNSTEMVMHVGMERAGWRGLFVAGISFIFPAAIITALLAHFYVLYGTLPAVEPWLLGIKAAVLALIASAVLKLFKKAIKNNALAILFGLVLLGLLLGLTEVPAILGAGLVYLMYDYGKNNFGFSSFTPIFPFLVGSKISGTTFLSISGTKIFGLFLKIGAVLFGSGYVLVAYLEGDIVDKLGWMTQAQLLDAIAAGQLSPGPVLTTATFVGYFLMGPSGALLATLGIFLPSFLFVALLNPVIPKLRKSQAAGLLLDGLNCGAVAAMAAVAIQFAYLSATDWKQTVMLLLALLIVFKTKKLSTPLFLTTFSLIGFALSCI